MTYVSSSAQTDEFEFFLPNSEEEVYETKSKNSKLYEPKLATSFHSLKIIKGDREGWMSRRTRKCLFLLVCLIAFSFIGLIFFGYYCSGSKALCDLPSYQTNMLMKHVATDAIGKHLTSASRANSFPTCDEVISKDFQKHVATDAIGKHLTSASRANSLPTFDEVISKDFQFNIEDHDVMVFLHIQKTGGTTFGRHLVKDLELERECVCHRKVKKRCTCLRSGTNSNETWLFSRYSTGWKCGLHADWTELASCVDDAMNKIDDHAVKRRYFYITYLRDPVHRYLSEYRHVKRGATWKNTSLFCKGRSATKEEVPPCYSGEDWSDVTLEEFISCKSNLAHNRQTRMLADLSLVNCYDLTYMKPENRDTIMLASAKSNLKRMAFFGLSEFQEINQYLFEETFNLKFNVRFNQFNQTFAEKSLKDIDPPLLEKIRDLNALDIELYQFAKQLLFERYKQLKKLDPHFRDHFKNMGHMSFSWEEVDKES